MNFVEKFNRHTCHPGSLAIAWMGQAGFLIKNSRGKVMALDVYLSDLAEKQDGNKRLMPALCLPEELDVDVLIPAAGIQRRHLPEEFPVEEWDLVRKINLDHVFLMIQKALKVMLKQPEGGKIITIGSMVSWFGGTTVPAYTASKGAVTQLTKSIAVDCAGRGININALAPGYMDTEMCANMTQERKDETSKRIPAVRWGTPEDMKGPVLFLASSASDYLNGAVIPVDGGYLCK